MQPAPADIPDAGWDDVLTRVRAGSETAARDLVDRLYPHVIRIVRSHLPRAADEEDLSQEIFMKIFSRLDRFRGEVPLPHWVARIAVNTCYDRLRRQKVRPELRFADLSEDEADFLQATMTAETEESAPREGAGMVEKLLATLNATEQTVLRLLDLDQKSVKEICDLTGWGASKIKVTAMRARRKLAETLRKLESSSQPV